MDNFNSDIMETCLQILGYVLETSHQDAFQLVLERNTVLEGIDDFPFKLCEKLEVLRSVIRMKGISFASR